MLRGCLARRDGSGSEAVLKSRQRRRSSRRPNLLKGEDLPPETVQQRSRDNRARLKAAGLAVFSEKGYQGAAIKDIAKRARLAVGGFYLHFHSKRQLLLVLMDDLLQGLSQITLAPSSPSADRDTASRPAPKSPFTPQSKWRGASHRASTDVRAAIGGLLTRAFSHDLRYLGACRAWQEAALCNHDLTRKQIHIQSWTTNRIAELFRTFQQLPNARVNLDIRGLAQAMDQLFWSLLSQATRLSKSQLRQRLDSLADLIFHGLFRDPAKPSPTKRR